MNVVLPHGLTGLVLLLLAAGPACGLVIWDESAAGDLGPESSPTPVVLFPGPNDLLGRIGTSNPQDPTQDSHDAIVFAIPAGHAWVGFELLFLQPNAPNQTTGFAVFEGSDSLTGVFLNGAPAAGTNVDLFHLLGLGPLPSGTYTMGVREFDSPGNEYSVRLTTVPEPSAMGLVMAALGLLGMRSRSRHRCGALYRSFFSR